MWVYINRPNARYTIHGDASCTFIHLKRTPERRVRTVTTKNLDQFLMELIQRRLDFTSNIDLWLQISLDSPEQELGLVYVVQALIGQRYRPLSAAPVTIHCGSQADDGPDQRTGQDQITERHSAMSDAEAVHVQGQRVTREKLSELGFRILPSTERGVAFRAALGERSIPIKVKTIRYGQWQFTASSLMDITISVDGVQTVHGRKPPPDPDLVCVLVKLDEGAFFILTLGELYDVVCTQYETWLAQQGGRRPNKPDSMHCQARGKDLIPWEDNWDLVRKRLAS